MMVVEGDGLVLRTWFDWFIEMAGRLVVSSNARMDALENSSSF